MIHLGFVACVLTGVVAASPSADAGVPLGRDEWLRQVSVQQVRVVSFEQDQKQYALPPPNKFKLEDHKKLAQKLGGPSGRCTDWLVSAQLRQDLFHQQQNEAHFDNCAIDQGAAYVASLVGEAQAAAKRLADATSPAAKDSALADGMLALGRALHATQDFYAHTNYLELEDETAPPPTALGNVALPRLWTADGRNALKQWVKDKGLHSGTWPIPPMASSRCGEHPEKHGELAKDSRDTPRGGRALARHPSWGKTEYDAAHALAERASIEFLSAAMPAGLIDACGPNLGFLLMTEKRSP